MEKRKSAKVYKRILITLMIGLILIICFFFITSAITKYTGFFVGDSIKNDFEECLKEQDINLFINSNIPSESLNKIELKDYLKDVKIMNCFRDNKVCSEKGIDSFPTWMINHNLIKKDISISDLSEISGCKLIK